MFTDLRHLRVFGHWPAWVRFDAFNVCERCLRPPRRPNVRRLVRAPARMSAL